MLGPHPVGVRPDWVTIRLTDRLVLSHCPKLNVARLRSRDGAEFHLLGLAVLADVAGASVAEVFSSKDSSEIEGWTGFWAGKWALISSSTCWQDASGCLGVYYRHAGDDVWISSSPALLSDHLPDTAPLPRIPWRVTHGKGMDWIPAPLTTREGIYKALPLRTVDPQTGAMRSVRFAAANKRAETGEQALASATRTIVANWAQSGFRERYVSLTAGLDTRTVLAAASAAHIDVRTCTTRTPSTARCDLALPPRLAACVGLSHQFFGPAGATQHEVESRSAAIAEHMDGATFHPMSTLFAMGADDFMHRHDRTIAGGNMYELGRCFFWDRFSRAGLGDTLPTADQLLAAFFPLPPEPLPFWREATRLWINSLLDPVPLDIDWRDRFYLDQRLGAWLSGIHRITDILDGAFFYPANCLWVFDLLLQHSIQERKEGCVQMRMIRDLAPGLSKFPVNPPRLSVRLKNAIRALLGAERARKLKAYARQLKRR